MSERADTAAFGVLSGPVSERLRRRAAWCRASCESGYSGTAAYGVEPAGCVTAYAGSAAFGVQSSRVCE